MNKFIRFNSILFSSAIFLLNPVFGMGDNNKDEKTNTTNLPAKKKKPKEKERLIMSTTVFSSNIPSVSSNSSSSSSTSTKQKQDNVQWHTTPQGDRWCVGVPDSNTPSSQTGSSSSSSSPTSSSSSVNVTNVLGEEITDEFGSSPSSSSSSSSSLSSENKIVLTDDVEEDIWLLTDDIILPNDVKKNYEQPPAGSDYWLPTEIWILVFSEMPAKNLAKICLVCRHWNEMVKSSSFQELCPDPDKYQLCPKLFWLFCSLEKSDFSDIPAFLLKKTLIYINNFFNLHENGYDKCINLKNLDAKTITRLGSTDLGKKELDPENEIIEFRAVYKLILAKAIMEASNLEDDSFWTIDVLDVTRGMPMCTIKRIPNPLKKNSTAEHSNGSHNLEKATNYMTVKGAVNFVKFFVENASTVLIFTIHGCEVEELFELACKNEVFIDLIEGFLKAEWRTNMISAHSCNRIVYESCTYSRPKILKAMLQCPKVLESLRSIPNLQTIPNNKDVFESLLKNQTVLNLLNISDSNWALNYVCAIGDDDLLNSLLQNKNILNSLKADGNEIKVVDKSYSFNVNTALYWACWNDHLNIVKTLLKNEKIRLLITSDTLKKCNKIAQKKKFKDLLNFFREETVVAKDDCTVS